METFIYKDLKKASLEKDITKVKTLGPYAWSMMRIINESLYIKLLNDKELLEKYRSKPLFRGILISEEQNNE